MTNAKQTSPASADSASRRPRAPRPRTAAIGHSSGATSSRPFPLSRMPRTMRRKCVSGKTSPMYCAHDRHAAEREHEAREQERRQEEEERHLHRLELVLGERREGDAHGEVGDDEEERGHQQEAEVARHRHLEEVAAPRAGSARPGCSRRGCTARSCRSAPRRAAPASTSRFSIVPRSRSRVMASAVIITIVIVSTTPMRPGTMLYCVIASGL